MSKGSWKRPVYVSHEVYSRNFDRIFGRPKPEEENIECDMGEDCSCGLVMVECEHCRYDNDVPMHASSFVCSNCERESQV